MTIYIVTGSTGEWSDRTKWLVKGWWSKEKAIQHVKDLEELYKTSSPLGDRYQRKNTLETIMKTLDPSFQEDYTGTHWYVQEVEVEDET